MSSIVDRMTALITEPAAPPKVQARFKLDVRLPSIDEVVANLSREACHPPLPAAKEAAKVATARVQEAEARLVSLTAQKAALVEAVADGNGKETDLAAVVAALGAVESLLPALRSRAGNAQRTADTEYMNAASALEKERSRRQKMINDAVADLGPVNAAVKQLEWALHCATFGK